MLYRFGAFTFDPASFELRGADGVRRLNEKPGAFLLALLKAGGEVVSREDLRLAIWGDDVHVDFDANINIIAFKVREALGDSADSPTHLETIPRRGYRLLVPVETGSRPVGRGKRPILAAATVAIVVSLVAISLIARREPIVEEPTPKRVTVMVLPLRDLGDGNAIAIASGLTEELTVRLGRIDPNALEVFAPRTAEIYFAREQEGEETIVRPDYLVDGSVRVADGNARISVRLVTDRRIVWSDQWDRPMRDVLSMQSEIAGKIARAAVPRLVVDPLILRARGGTDNPAAFDEYALGRKLWGEFEPEGFRRSLARFERAIALDPAYAEAWAGKADAWNMLALFGEVDRDEGLLNAREAARSAIELDGSVAEAHAALAMSLFHGERKDDEALAEYVRALELAPSRALTYQWLAGLYTAMGRTDDAVAAARHARRLDPLSLSVNSDLGWYLYYAGKFEEAVAHGLATLELYPESGATLFCTELSLRALGRDREAFETMLRRLQIEGVSAADLSLLDEQFESNGPRAACLANARRIEVTGDRPKTLYSLAVYRALGGDGAGASEALREAASSKVSWLPYVDADPVLSLLAGD